VAAARRDLAPELVVATAVVALGAGLRFFRLGFQSLWFDELFSVVYSRSGTTVAAIVERYAADVHSPVYPVVLHLWLRLLGDGDVAARSLSAVCGALGIVVVAIATRRLLGGRCAVIAALLTAVNAYHIAYSQEARSYAMVFVFAMVATVAQMVAVEHPVARNTVIWGVAVALAFYVHYFALVLFAGQVVAAAIVLVVRRDGWRSYASLGVATLTVAAAMLPWLAPFLRVARFEQYWPAVPEPWFFIDYFHGYFGRSLALSLLVAVLLASLPLLLRRQPGESDDQARRLRARAILLGLTVGLALAIAYVRSVLVVPMLVDRFTFVLLPAVLLLVAIALSRLRPAALRIAVVGVVTALSLANLALTGYYTEPRKEQWREATAWVVRHPEFDADADVVLAIYAPGFQYYADRQRPGVTIDEATPEAVLALLDRDPAPPALWLLTARRAELPAESGDLLRRRFEQTDRAGFIATRAERWERGPGPEADRR
jgi:uncharacterized membrane protein